MTFPAISRSQSVERESFRKAIPRVIVKLGGEFIKTSGEKKSPQFQMNRKPPG